MLTRPPMYSKVVSGSCRNVTVLVGAHFRRTYSVVPNACMHRAGKGGSSMLIRVYSKRIRAVGQTGRGKQLHSPWQVDVYEYALDRDPSWPSSRDPRQRTHPRKIPAFGALVSPRPMLARHRIQHTVLRGINRAFSSRYPRAKYYKGLGPKLRDRMLKASTTASNEPLEDLDS